MLETTRKLFLKNSLKEIKAYIKNLEQEKEFLGHLLQAEFFIRLSVPNADFFKKGPTIAEIFGTLAEFL